jgi:hypothetical protein
MVDEDYMNVDTGRKNPVSTTIKVDLGDMPEPEAKKVVRKRWEIQWYVNFIEPQEMTSVIDTVGEGVPPSDLIIERIVLANPALKEKRHMIKVTKLLELSL